MNIDENECAFYEITIKNQNATLQSQIIINQDYPKVYPLFLININWKHAKTKKRRAGRTGKSKLKVRIRQSI